LEFCTSCHEAGLCSSHNRWNASYFWSLQRGIMCKNGCSLRSSIQACRTTCIRGSHWSFLPYC
jgi:hypothetical protein